MHPASHQLSYVSEFGTAFADSERLETPGVYCHRHPLQMLLQTQSRQWEVPLKKELLVSDLGCLRDAPGWHPHQSPRSSEGSQSFFGPNNSSPFFPRCTTKDSPYRAMLSPRADPGPAAFVGSGPSRNLDLQQAARHCPKPRVVSQPAEVSKPTPKCHFHRPWEESHHRVLDTGKSLLQTNEEQAAYNDLHNRIRNTGSSCGKEQAKDKEMPSQSVHVASHHKMVQSSCPYFAQTEGKKDICSRIPLTSSCDGDPTGDCSGSVSGVKISTHQRQQLSATLPAWIFCTRYSDRPSAGRRLKKPRASRTRNGHKRGRTAFSTAQVSRLQREFDKDPYLTEYRRQRLAGELSMGETQIKIWFQNKRAKLKKTRENGFTDGR